MKSMKMISKMKGILNKDRVVVGRDRGHICPLPSRVSCFAKQPRLWTFQAPELSIRASLRESEDPKSVNVSVHFDFSLLDAVRATSDHSVSPSGKRECRRPSQKASDTVHQ
jgi:hypothetical protein